jgi:hypothetical protein
VGSDSAVRPGGLLVLKSHGVGARFPGLSSGVGAVLCPLQIFLRTLPFHTFTWILLRFLHRAQTRFHGTEGDRTDEVRLLRAAPYSSARSSAIILDDEQVFGPQ